MVIIYLKRGDRRKKEDFLWIYRIFAPSTVFLTRDINFFLSGTSVFLIWDIIFLIGLDFNSDLMLFMMMAKVQLQLKTISYSG